MGDGGVRWIRRSSGGDGYVHSATFQLKESVPNADTGADLSENDYPGFFTTSTVTAKDGQVTIEIGEVPVYLVLQEDGG